MTLAAAGLPWRTTSGTKARRLTVILLKSVSAFRISDLMGTTVSRTSLLLSPPPSRQKPILLGHAAVRVAVPGYPLPVPGRTHSQRASRIVSPPGPVLSSRGPSQQFPHASWGSWAYPAHYQPVV